MPTSDLPLPQQQKDNNGEIALLSELLSQKKLLKNYLSAGK